MGLLADAVLPFRIGMFAVAAPWLFRLPVRRLEALANPSRQILKRDAACAKRIIWWTAAVCRVARRFTRHPCQVRGLTLYYFLCRAGFDVSLVFGIGRVGEGYSGHCWLVKDGEPYLEAVDPRIHFTSMYAFHCGDAAVLQDPIDRRIFT